MFDFSFTELLVVAVVALIVLGPERLPKAARFAGLWVRRARAQWYSVKSELESELADDELKRSLSRMQDELRQAREQLRDGGESLRREFDGLDPDREPPPQPPAPAPGEPGPGEPGPGEPGPGEPPQRDPGSGEPARREPGPPAPEKREPDPRSPDRPDPADTQLAADVVPARAAPRRGDA